MSLIRTYEKFTNIDTEFIAFIEKAIKDDFQSFTEEQMKMNLKIALKNYENLKFESDEINAKDDEEKNNLNDLKYLIMSGLFLVSDLQHFYSLNEYERFKMRGINYINNSRRRKVV
ncbi:hypothetical protein [Clostridium sp. 1001271B_151109_B4]|uniref:hypothetical protein n=1 Tax=Clostridium sp. 1001271B_151109_B4 TaxID=2787148 RepID=UPI0018AC34BB|nr:hypothetical protein [Clostridium sp. 1001271B_151109_B4]